jgi:hypothetical protein
MNTRSLLQRCASALCALSLAAFAAGQNPSPAASHQNIAVEATAWVQTKLLLNGREQTKLVPADQVVPGDEVIYKLEIRNLGAMALPPPTIDYPIPEHMRYLANSAVGAGADVSYSVDHGHTYDRPENLKVTTATGERAATAADYTHIRWQLKHILKGNSVALANFRAVVK